MNARPARTIDLNCDLGESREPAQRAADLALLDVVTSANIACGGHAGDEETMAATVEAALRRGVAIGAHPGYPDRANFGRIALKLPPDTVLAFVAAQIGALEQVVRGQGGRLTHVKTHGALYHVAMRDEPVARAVAAAVKQLDPALVMVAMHDTPALRIWRAEGLKVLVEAFADRAYAADGSLRNRTQPGALITDPTAAAEQAAQLAKVHTTADAPLTICIHSDTPGAVAVANAVRGRLEHEGFNVAAPR